MYCKSCGKKIDDDSKFCSICGTKQSIDIKPIIYNDLSSKKFPTSVKDVFVDDKKNPKYDERYSKESDATALGLFLLLINLGMVISGPKFYDENSYIVFKIISSLASLVIRIFSTIWVVNIAERQNRNTMSWGIFAFVLPSFALIIIGQTKKLFDPYEQKKKSGSMSNNAYEDFLRARGQ